MSPATVAMTTAICRTMRWRTAATEAEGFQLLSRNVFGLIHSFSLFRGVCFARSALLGPPCATPLKACADIRAQHQKGRRHQQRQHRREGEAEGNGCRELHPPLRRGGAD